MISRASTPSRVPRRAGQTHTSNAPPSARGGRSSGQMSLPGVSRAARPWLLNAMLQTCKNVIENWTERVRHEVHEFFNVVHEVCEWLPWPLDDFCDLVTDVVEKMTEWFEDVVHTIARVVCTPIDLAVAHRVEGGRADRLAADRRADRAVGRRGPASFVIDEIGGLPEGLAGLIGWLPKKHLDLHVFVLRDHEGRLVLESEIGQVLKETERIYWARARVAVTTTVHMLESVAPDAAFDIDRDGGMFGEDLTAAGSYFQATAAQRARRLREPAWSPGGRHRSVPSSSATSAVAQSAARWDRSRTGSCSRRSS